MAKNNKTTEAKMSKKRAASEESDVEEDEDKLLSVDGLIDAEASESDEDDDEYESAVEEKESSSDKEAQDDSDDDSDAELNKLLAEEEGDGEEDYDSSEFSDDTTSLTDRLSGVKLQTIVDPNIYSKYADGSDRIIKPEINPVYDSDDSDAETQNTIGNIPLSAYDEMPHIGYDINGKRIMRPAKGSALDQLLDSIELPEGWTGLLDKNSGSSLNLTKEELELISKIQRNEQTDDSINPYEPLIDWFTRHEEVMPLTAVPEPKRRFVPSKNEAKRVMKIVRAIREGRIIPPKN